MKTRICLKYFANDCSFLIAAIFIRGLKILHTVHLFMPPIRGLYLQLLSTNVIMFKNTRQVTYL